VSPRGEAGGRVRRKGHGHCVAEAEVKVKAKKCRHGRDGCCEGEVLFSELLKDKSLRSEASERREASEG